VICLSCRHEPPSGSQFCNRCGAPLELRCPSCDNTVPPGSQFCNSCGHSLAPITPTTPPDRTPRDYTPKHLADKILRSKSALEGERKQVTVLFADVKGSMELAEQVDSEEWHAILDRFFQILADGVHRFEGTVNQYTGDGIMALFGAPIAHEDHAQRACWAALHLRDELRRYADELRVERALNFSTRMGMNSGEVVVGKIGDDLRMDYTAQGQTVGLAARMEELAESGRVYLTQHTADLATGYFELRDLGASQIKGLSEPLHLFELEGVGRLRTRLEVSRARGFSRFVGRSGEMATLESALIQAGEGRGQVVGVVGEAGVGKSRLCLEFVEGCRARGIAVHEAHCPAHGKAVSFLPLLELLRAYFGIAERDSAAEARRKIAGTLLLQGEAMRELLPLVFDFVGVPDPDQPVLRMEPEVRQQRLFAFVRQLFEARGTGAPSVTLVDDLQWIDAGSDAFLAQVAEVVNGSRTLLLLNFRPEYQASWMRKSYYQQLPLAPLGTQAMGELLADLLGRDASLSELSERIAERTRGNPFFTEELVQSLAEVGRLEGSRGAYRLTRAVEELELPATVQAVLSARIDRLGECEKRLLQTTSVIGKELSEAVLRRVAELPEADLQAALASLTEAEFLYPKALFPDLEYAFRHPLTQEVAYGSQLGEHRQRVHASVARALEEVHAESADEHAALVAHHWENAGEALEAARWHRRAADWAGLRNLEEALRHWRSCQVLTADLSESAEADAIHLAACVGVLRGATWYLDVANEEAQVSFREGRSLAEQAGDPTTLATLLLLYSGALAAREAFVEGLSVRDQAIQLSDRTGDNGLRAWARTFYMTPFRAGRLEEMRVRSEEGLDLVAGDPELGSEYAGFSPLVALTGIRGAALCFQGRLGEGFEAIDRAMELARQHDQMLWLAVAHLLDVGPSFRAADLDRVMRDVRELAVLVEKQPTPVTQVSYQYALGLSHLAREEWEEAARRFEPIQGISGLFPAYLAEAYLGCGDRDRARTVAEQAVARNCASGALLSEIHALITLARVLRTIDAARELETIEASLSRAEGLVQETGARLRLPSLHEERARLAQALGRPSDAERELREAHRLYTEIGATGHADRLAEELGL
jgi:class 3 adenylate cyclase/tetratricopeptide (TPR) repeat protein